MSSFEWNKIIASVLTAMIVAMVSGILAGELVRPKPLEKPVFLPAGTEQAATAPAEQGAAAGPEPIEPLLAKQGHQPLGRVAIATVKGDLHDIGKNLVAMMLKGAGFDVTDLGVDVGPEKFVERAKAVGTDFVGISALLTTTMPSMEKTITALKKAGVKAKVLIGGAPVTQGYADKIGADGYAPDAASAVDLAKSLLN